MTGVQTCALPISYSGIVEFVTTGSNSWVGTTLVLYSTSGVCTGAGAVTLAGALDRIALTTVAGTSAFTAGTVNVSWE